MCMDLEACLDYLRQQGCRITPQRQRIVEILLQSPDPVAARDILQQMRVAFPNVSLDTVYRNLGMMTAIGLTSQLNLRNRETARFELQRKHHHHLVCLSCGRAECIESCPMTAYDLAHAQKKRFRVVDHAFEVYGYCADCAASSAGKLPEPPTD